MALYRVGTTLFTDANAAQQYANQANENANIAYADQMARLGISGVPNPNTTQVETVSDDANMYGFKTNVVNPGYFGAQPELMQETASYLNNFRKQNPNIPQEAWDAAVTSEAERYINAGNRLGYGSNLYGYAENIANAAARLSGQPQFQTDQNLFNQKQNQAVNFSNYLAQNQAANHSGILNETPLAVFGAMGLGAAAGAALAGGGAATSGLGAVTSAADLAGVTSAAELAGTAGLSTAGTVGLDAAAIANAEAAAQAAIGAQNTGGVFFGTNGLINTTTGNMLADSAINGGIRGAITTGLTGGDVGKGALAGAVGGFGSLVDTGNSIANAAISGGLTGGTNAALNGKDILTGALGGAGGGAAGALVTSVLPTDISKTVSGGLSGATSGLVNAAITGGDLTRGVVGGGLSGVISGGLQDLGVDSSIAKAAGGGFGGILTNLMLNDDQSANTTKTTATNNANTTNTTNNATNTTNTTATNNANSNPLFGINAGGYSPVTSSGQSWRKPLETFYSPT